MKISWLPLALFVLSAAPGAGVLPLQAQETPQGPMEAPPEHHVTRIGTESEPPAPPSLPVEEIVRRFSQKEEEYLSARPRYGFLKSVRVQEFGPDGSLAGEFLRVTEYTKSPDGGIAVKAVEKPQSTLQGIYLAPEDLDAAGYPAPAGLAARAAVTRSLVSSGSTPNIWKW